MTLGEIWLQPQRFVRVETRFLPPRRIRVGVMIDPALHHGETGERQRKLRIELDGLFEKRYGLQRRVAKHVPPRCVIVRLNEKQIRVGVFGWPLIKPRFFVWRQFRLKGRRNFLREVGLNREDVGQIAIVIFRPNVLVVIRIDQLHVHSDAVADPTDTAFQKRGNAQRFANFTSVANARVAIRTSQTCVR